MDEVGKSENLALPLLVKIGIVSTYVLLNLSIPLLAIPLSFFAFRALSRFRSGYIFTFIAAVLLIIVNLPKLFSSLSSIEEGLGLVIISIIIAIQTTMVLIFTSKYFNRKEIEVDSSSLNNEYLFSRSHFIFFVVLFILVNPFALYGTSSGWSSLGVFAYGIFFGISTFLLMVFSKLPSFLHIPRRRFQVFLLLQTLSYLFMFGDGGDMLGGGNLFILRLLEGFNILNLGQLPNYAYVLALALFALAQVYFFYFLHKTIDTKVLSKQEISLEKMKTDSKSLIYMAIAFAAFILLLILPVIIVLFYHL
ncbi:MAG: hypothetical protein J5I47_05995 [Vicingus serpentipes]|nr:hypothetical protein [Vicingus serpentipes]